MLGIILIIFAFVIILYLLKSGCKGSCHQHDNYKHIGMFSDVYDQQDFIKNHPQVYPIPYDYTTGVYALHRDLLREKEEKKSGCRAWDPYRL